MRAGSDSVAGSMGETAAANRLCTIVLLACFFTSGFVSLLYEICWIRKATHVFGAATFAVSTVVAVFFGGMALGAYLFGRYSLRTTRPLRAYAVLEIALGLLAMASPAALELADTVFGLLYPLLEGSFARLSLARFLLIMVVLLPPTILIGGTLPLFCREFVRSPQRIGFSVAMLYACNTLGAAAGCAVTGLWLISSVGLNPSIWLGAALNGAIGVTILWHYAPGRFLPSHDNRTLPAASPGPPSRRRAVVLESAGPRRTRIVYGLFFLAGFVALGNEILWTRYLSLLVRNTVYTYTVSLSIILIGIVLGSALVAGVLDRLRHRGLLFGLLQVVGGLLVLGILLAPPDLWRNSIDPTSVGASLWVFVAVLLPPAVLSGAAFPLAVRLVVNDPALSGVGVGTMTAVNTLGGILGALSMGFLVLPLLGLHSSLLILTGCALLIGFVSGWLLEGSMSPATRLTLTVACAAIWLAIPQGLKTRLPQDFLAPPGALVDFREGLGCHMAVVQRGEVVRLEIDQLWQGQNRKSHQVMAAHIPMILHPEARDVAVVGLGTGQTCSRFLMYDVQRVDCIEIEGRLAELVRGHFDSEWMSDERLRMIIEDGRNYLTHTRTEYDLIAIEVGQVFRPGLASFYTLDFYQAAQRRLRPDGCLCQFVPIAAFTPDEFRTIVRTFIATFPQSTLWYNTSELLLIGRNADGWHLAPDQLAAKEARETARRDMHFAHWGGPEHTLDRAEVFLGGFLSGPDGLARIASSAPVYRDDRPYLEYTTSRYLERGEVAIVEVLREGIDPLSAIMSPDLAQATVDQAASIRELNLRNVIAAAFERTASELPFQETARRVELLQTAVRWNPKNVQINRLCGDALLLAGRQEEAVASYRAAVAVDPADATARSHLGRGLYTLGQYPEAAEHLRVSVELDPSDGEAHNNLGAALAAQHDLDGAAAHFAEAVRLGPERSEWRKNLNAIRTLLEREQRAAP